MKSNLEYPVGNVGTAGAEPIAIVSIGGIFPGARTLDDFWKLLERGVDTSRTVPAHRWILNPREIQHPIPGMPDRVYTERGCFVEDFKLDVAGLRLPPGLVETLDPAFHLLLEAGRNAFQGAALGSVDRNRIGVICGNIALPTEASSTWGERFLEPLLEPKTFVRTTSLRALGKQALNRYVTGMPAGVLAQALGLGGGTCTLDAACASSLYAVKLACDELQTGRADAILTGGLSRPDSLYTQMGFCQLRALSLSGRCAPFDVTASGLIVGEGAGVLVLKRLADALRDGDHIYAVIRGIGLSNDLEGNLLSPSSEGQLRALQHAYQQAGWSPDQVDLIECHATGTPIGDAVEFESLLKLWQDCAWRPGQCVLGAVKSNIGHLLTAAGSAGLIKLVLALQHNLLPATANFQQPAEKIPLINSPFRILKEGQPWPRRSPAIPRRAAINGFGFGGINAHVLIEEWIGEAEPSHARPRSVRAPVPVAIVGMAVRVGRWPTLRAFQERVLGGGNNEQPRKPTFWRGIPWERLCSLSEREYNLFPGFYLDDLELPLDRYRIPPKELGELLPQQALMLETARSALADARLAPVDPTRTGVFIGLGLDLRTTDFHFRWAMLAEAARWADELFSGDAAAEKAAWMQELCTRSVPPLTADRTLGALAGVNASRIAKEFHFGGPSHTICSEDCSGIRALEVALRALQQGELGQALAGAVDVTSDPRSLLATHTLRPFSRKGTPRPFDIEADGPIPGEGAVAVVLKRLEDARRDGDRVYAVIRGIGGASIARPDAGLTEVYLKAMQRAYQEAGVDPSSIGYIEAHGSGWPDEDRQEVEALGSFFGSSERTTVCRIGNAKADVGHTGAASGLVSVIKASLALYQEIIPPLRGLQQPLPELRQAANLRVPRFPQYWPRNRAEGPRRAGVSCLSVDGNCMHVVLEACEDPLCERWAEERKRPLGVLSEALFALRGNNPTELSHQVAALRKMAVSGAAKPVEVLAGRWWGLQPENHHPPHALAIIARDTPQLLRLLDQAAETVRNGCAQKPSERSADARPVCFAQNHPGCERMDAYANESQSSTKEDLLNQDRERLFYTPVQQRVQGDIAFVFPGAGNQFAEMGRELALYWPEILRAQDCENLFLAGQMYADRFWNVGSQYIDPSDHRLLICGHVALGAMVSDLAGYFGLRPKAVIGYSLGESTGLFALRAWTDRDEMLRRVSKSTLFTHELAGKADVLRRVWQTPPDQIVEWQAGLVDRSVDAVQAVIKGRGRIYVLIINTPGECVIGGEASEVKALIAQLGCHWIPLEGVSTVHCELLHPVENAYRELHLFNTTAPGGVRFYSGAWGRAYNPDRSTAAEAIVAQARNCIDFPKVIHTAHESGIRIFLEMGPGNSCSRMISQILAGRPHLARSLCASAQEPLLGVLRTLGQLIAEGVFVDLTKLYGDLVAANMEAESEPEVERKRVLIPISGSAFASPLLPPLARRKDPFELELLQGMTDAQAATLQAHQAYLDFSRAVFENLAQNVQEQFALISAVAIRQPGGSLQLPSASEAIPSGTPRSRGGFLDRQACLEFARGSVAKVLGSAFAKVDTFPTRVRLPDEPLMLVDRIVEVHGEARSMTSGRIVTEHDILPGAWYLDHGRIPTCIAVEAGQADLFLSGFLGIDFQTQGRAVYRLLDARICFHRGLPGPGTVIRYDIRIERFFQQGTIWLFEFNFDATVEGQPLLTMTHGCAGFFSDADLAGGRGIVRTTMDQQSRPGRRDADWEDFVATGVESYSAEQLDALRAAQFEKCFGAQFANLALQQPITLPAGRMRLVHRIPYLNPAGGRFGLGLIRGEADIHPNDWFLACHFVDDRVMPGTLMFECCLHTLRVFLLRLGWIVEQSRVVLEPVPEVAGQLKCRGQVLETTSMASYEVTIKEMGYRPEPYVVADALMYADGKPIVEITNMSLRYAGITREDLRQSWRAARSPSAKRAVYDHHRILAFAIGKPSEAFGPPYAVFDARRRIARLPGPPYQFLDRITAVEGEPFKMVPGGTAEAEYDVPPKAWYFAENCQDDMPFAVLLEIALQPCGWLAAYIGSALTSEDDLYFRNLGGTGLQLAPVLPASGTLVTQVKLPRLSSSAGMIIQWFEFEVRAGTQSVYRGDTYFGFFPKEALLRQEGLREAKIYQPSATELSRGKSLAYPDEPPFAAGKLRMVDHIDLFIPDGGPNQLGFIRGRKRVDPEEWFFKAHFYQDPVVPGSLGLESLLQLLKFLAIKRWGHKMESRWEAVTTGLKHEWIYRGQVLPSNRLITIEAVVTSVNEPKCRLTGDGWLSVDGRAIYAMKNFTVRQQPRIGTPPVL